MKRLARLTNILLQLQSKRLVTAQELAGKFNITQRTVYRDIQALEEAGVPIIGEAGKGYCLAEGYRIPPVMFTEQEINALLTAQQYLQKIADKSVYNDLTNTVAKIKAIIRYSEKEKAERLQERILVIAAEQKDATNLLSAIQLAITNCSVLKIKYHTIYSDSITERLVEPLAVYLTKDNWIMIAFCRHRNNLREFRLDRILKLTTSSDTFPDRHFTFEDYISSFSEK
jgi:predicted DNA-binding transcriptional regulator YafY